MIFWFLDKANFILQQLRRAATAIRLASADLMSYNMTQLLLYCVTRTCEAAGARLDPLPTTDAEGDLQVPWEDLRYIFGEIMYGGHIVEDWDRRLASAYLLKYFQPGLSDGINLFPGFSTPPTNLSYQQVRITMIDLGTHRSHEFCSMNTL